jgi:hypothetical protein
MIMKMTAKFVERYPISPAQYWDLEGFKKEQKPESWLSRVARTLFEKFGSSTDPQIRLKYGPAGREYWRVYDPTTGKTATFTEESDVRVWLEQRYYA